jgi:hypothetical protein
MKSMLKKKILSAGLMATAVFILTQCTSAPEWKAKNDELIKQ